MNLADHEAAEEGRAAANSQQWKVSCYHASIICRDYSTSLCQGMLYLQDARLRAEELAATQRHYQKVQEKVLLDLRQASYKSNSQYDSDPLSCLQLCNQCVIVVKREFRQSSQYFTARQRFQRPPQQCQLDFHCSLRAQTLIMFNNSVWVSVTLCSNISSSTGGLRESVETMLWYAQHGNSMLTQLLGNSYAVDDVMFYAASLIIIWVASSGPQMHPARLPLIDESNLTSEVQYGSFREICGAT